MSFDAFHYAPGEVTIPDGIRKEHLDWVLFAWDLHRAETLGRPEETAQLLLGPGVFLHRFTSERGKLFTVGYGNATHYYRSYPCDDPATMLDQSRIQTRTYLEIGHEWVRTPFAVNFTSIREYLKVNPGHFTPRHSPNSIGDAMLSADRETLQLIFDHVNRTRADTAS